MEDLICSWSSRYTEPDQKTKHFGPEKALVGQCRKRSNGRVPAALHNNFVTCAKLTLPVWVAS
jgi:hypothetical protein